MSEPTVNPFTPPSATIDAAPAPVTNAALAERGSRLAAVLLDGLTFLPMGILFGIGVAMAPRSTDAPSAPSPMMGVLMGIGGLYALGIAIYQIYLLSTRGQTLGKKWMGIKIVKLDGSNPGFVGAVLLRAFVNGLIGAIPYLGMVYSLVDILMIFREDRRCVHDMIAGTRVVKA
jgi:uncharacterized RDD family membrane protein YckC